MLHFSKDGLYITGAREHCYTANEYKLWTKAFCYDAPANTDQLPLGLKDESGVREGVLFFIFFTFFFYFSISCLVMDMEHSILPLVEFTAIVFLPALATMSCVACFFFVLFFILPLRI